ncbi:MAG: FUSC family protein [Candidatus Nanopelagicales bacterium]|nr:FUSC family protein [Candidatus Nanopelagicales bacterium]
MTTTARPGAKALVLALALFTVATFAPVAVVSALGWHTVVPIALLTGLSAVMASLTGGGWRTGLLLAVPFAAFAGVLTWAQPHAWAAALVMAAAALLRGLTAIDGLHNALMTSVITLGFVVAKPPTPQTDLAAPVAVALVVLATCLWVTLIALVTRRWSRKPALVRIPRQRAIAFSVVLALMVGAATWFVVRLDLGEGGAWIILTLLVVVQPYLKDGMRKAIERSAGTLLGFVLAVAIGLLTTSSMVLGILGAACMVTATAAMILGRPYWQYAAFLTAAIILFVGSDGSVLHTAEVRLGATLIAVVATMAVIIVLTPVARNLADRAGLDRY